MGVTLTVSLDNCNQCHHNDHSGSFTAGGARQICGHSDACKARRSKEEFLNEYPMYGKRDLSSWKYHWYNRITDGEIPDWCPLKHGSGY